MATWIYNNKILNSHPLSKCCKSTLNQISNDDYPNTNYFNKDIECLDMDTYEQNRKGVTGKTVDAVIGISDCENKREINPRLLCVELRMGYKSTRNFSSAFADKVTHSKGLLGGYICIESKSLFVFKDELAPQAKNWIKNKRNSGGGYKDMDSCGISDFGNIIKSIDEMPYKPLNNEKQIRDILSDLENKEDWNSFIKKINDLCIQALKYKYHNPFEYDFMIGLLKDVWIEFRANHTSSLGADEEIFAEIMEEDYTYLVN